MTDSLYSPCPFCGAGLTPVKGRGDIAVHEPEPGADCLIGTRIVAVDAWEKRADTAPAMSPEDQIKDKAKKFLGLPPYNGVNPCYLDGRFYQSMVREFGQHQVDEALAAEQEGAEQKNDTRRGHG